MSLNTAQQAIKVAFEENSNDFDFLEILLMGGEPLCEFPLIKKIAAWLPSVANGKKYILFAVTNGTLLTDESKEWFQENKECVCLGLSYDGEYISQDMNRNGSREKIDLPFFINTWPEQPLKMTISEESVGYFAQNVISLHDMGALVNANCACGCDDWQTKSWEIYGNQLNKLVKYYIANPTIKPINLIVGFNLFNLFDITEKIESCHAGKTFYAIDVDGKKYPCHLFSPLAQAPNHVLDYESFQKQLSSESNPCAECILNGNCSNCIGMNYKLYGHAYHMERNLCIANQFQFRACIKFHTERIKRAKDMDKDDCFIAKTILMLAQKNFSLRRKDYFVR